MTKVKNPNLPQWEQEYLLAKTQEFFITEEYMDMGKFYFNQLQYKQSVSLFYFIM